MVELLKLILYSGPSVLLIVAGVFWGKNLIEYFFDKNLETKKIELNQNLESFKSQIEKQNKDFQHQLDTKLNEFNIRFSKLHQERAEAIKKLYVKIVELHSAMMDFTRLMKPVIEDHEKEEQERLSRVNSAFQDFNNFYLRNRIFFEKSMVEKLDNLSKEYWDKGWDFAFMNQQFQEGSLSKEVFQEYFEKSKKISETVEKDFTKLIEEIEDEFRKMLGVEEE